MGEHSETQCVKANPDIAGIGVMIAMFTQAALSFVAPTLAILDRRITKEESKQIIALPSGNLILLCSLLFTGVLQAHSKSLSAYHGLMISTLAWVLEGNLIFSHPLASRALKALGLTKEETVGDVVPPGAISMVLSISRISLGTWGIYFSFLVHSRRLNCLDSTFLVIFGFKWYLSSPGFVLMSYSLNTSRVLLGILGLVLHSGETGWKRGPDVKVNRTVVFIRMLLALGALVLLIFIAVETHGESRKAGLVSDGEAELGFGQVLALCLLVSQLVTVGKAFLKWMRQEHQKVSKCCAIIYLI
jgi:hypothetical protein